MKTTLLRLLSLLLIVAALPVLAPCQRPAIPKEPPVPASPPQAPSLPPSPPQAAPHPPSPPAITAPQANPAPEARPGDVDTVEHLLAAVYDVISGPAGQPRDWDRFRSFFYPGIARLMPSGRNAAGEVGARSLTPDEYVGRASGAFAKDGFYESAVANRIEVWDHIAHVWSAYESRHNKDEKPFARGINSFQFIHDGKRWWVLTIYWEGEDPAHPIPEKYLK